MIKTSSTTLQTAGHVTLTKAKDRLLLKFLPRPVTIARVHTLIEKHVYKDGPDWIWTASLCMRNINMLTEWGFTFDRELTNKINAQQTKKLLKTDHLSLRPFQEIGVQFIESRNGRALLCDQQGLGKTVQGLTWLSLQPDKAFPAVAITKSSAKLKWEREVNRWIPGASCKVLFGQTRYKNLHRFDVLLVNYDILQYHLEALKDAKPRTSFIDECQMTKNGKAQRTKAVLKLCKGMKHVIPMSGTPIINRPVEFWNMLNLVKPSLFNNYFHYVKRYCDAHSNGFALDVNGSSNEEELHQILTQSIMIRRLKSEVLPELPPKIYDIVPLEIDRHEYDLTMNEFSLWLDDHPDNPAAAMVRIEKAKQAAVHGKLKAAIEWIEDFLEDGSKLVLFGWHVSVLDELATHFKKKCVRIQGTPQEKQRAIDAFQNEAKVQLAIANMQAAGDSIDLTAANDVAFIELPWTPTDLEQCEDRCYGRLNDLHGATIHFLAAMDTIEIKIAELLVEKNTVVSSVIDGGTSTSSILHQLLKQYRRK